MTFQGHWIWSKHSKQIIKGIWSTVWQISPIYNEWLTVNWFIFVIILQIEDSTDSGTETDDETGGPDEDFMGKILHHAALTV
jgi:hypothetical protein